MKIGKNILRIRTEKNLTGKELSVLSGVSQSSISDIEKDHRSPQVDTLEKLCAALQVRIMDVMPDEIRLDRSFNEEEMCLLECFHLLTQKEKKALLVIIKSISSRT